LIHSFAEMLIKNRLKEPLLDLNKTVKVIGNTVTFGKIEEYFFSKYPDLEFYMLVPLINSAKNNKLGISDFCNIARKFDISISEKGLFKTTFCLKIGGNLLELDNIKTVVTICLPYLTIERWRIYNSTKVKKQKNVWTA
jgi:hypothetical protein